jgi:hypothetical protein
MASNQMRIEIYGVKEALRELNKINPKLRREFTKQYKEISKPVLDAAKAKFPMSPPISGMGRPYKKFGGWDGGLVAKGVIAKINTRKARNRNAAEGAAYETVGTFIIQQKTGWGSIFDIAGRKTPSSMLAQSIAGKGFGNASRAMWPAYEQHQNEVDRLVTNLVEGVMDETNRNLVMNDGN